MMRDLDQEIAAALDRDEREILARIGEEPGFFGMAFGLFLGRLGWVNVLMMVVQAVLFVAGVYAAWKFFLAGDPVTQLRWGLPAMTLMIVSLMIKMSMWPQIHTDRLLRALARAELRLLEHGRAEK
jgi:hypothetical protein